MKLLLDANISRRLIHVLTEHFGECTHVNTVGLTVPATDTEIWNFANQNGYIIVTQDSDFLHFFEVKGHPPKVVLIRMGNMNNIAMAELLISSKSAIKDLDNGDYGLLEIISGKY
ncbi:hypothetical protein FACS1894161_0040 [Spirochaetia bacterium]|nr:hypothetical protein FACS1894161_0040 [Spirochaetia bacterium]